MPGTWLEASAALGPQDVMATGATGSGNKLSSFQKRLSVCRKLAGERFQKGVCLGHQTAALDSLSPWHEPYNTEERRWVWQQKPSIIFIPIELSGSQGDRTGDRLTPGVFIFQFLPQRETLISRGRSSRGDTHIHTDTHRHRHTHTHIWEPNSGSRQL